MKTKRHQLFIQIRFPVAGYSDPKIVFNTEQEKSNEYFGYVDIGETWVDCPDLTTEQLFEASRTSMIEALEQEKVRAKAELNQTLAKIDDKIQQLLAIECKG